MEFNIYSFLGVCAIIYTRCNFPTAYALVGSEVIPAEQGQFPFLVAFRHVHHENLNPTRDHICTGSMISRSHVLSAAQCTRNRLKSETVVLHGSNSLASATIYTIRWWINFNDWSAHTNTPLEFADNDICVTKLNHEIARGFQIGILSTEENDNLFGQCIELAGWGVNNRRAMSKTILTSIATVLSNVECEAKLAITGGRRLQIHRNHFCTHHQGITLLKRGDFGGPVLFFNRIIGVNKEVLPDVVKQYDKHKVNVHTSINYYRSFITHVTANNFVWR